MIAPPTEWQAKHDADGDWAIFEGSELVAVTNSDTEWDERNAKLIAAAPAMAALLVSAWSHVSHGGPRLTDVEAVLKEAGVL